MSRISYFINISFKTPNILSATEMKMFVIDLKKEGDGVKIDVGSGTAENLIMSRSWDSNPYDSWPPTLIAFAAFIGNADFSFCLD